MDLSGCISVCARTPIGPRDDVPCTPQIRVSFSIRGAQLSNRDYCNAQRFFEGFAIVVVDGRFLRAISQRASLRRRDQVYRVLCVVLDADGSLETIRSESDEPTGDDGRRSARSEGVDCCEQLVICDVLYCALTIGRRLSAANRMPAVCSSCSREGKKKGDHSPLRHSHKQFLRAAPFPPRSETKLLRHSRCTRARWTLCLSRFETEIDILSRKPV